MEASNFYSFYINDEPVQGATKRKDEGEFDGRARKFQRVLPNGVTMQ